MYTFVGVYWPFLEEPYCNPNTMRTLLLLCIAIFSFGFVQAQDCTGADHTVLAGNYYYIPSTLTVTAGETIAFQNEGGFHNVNGVSSTLGDTWSNPETFSLGANSGSTGGVCMGTVTLNTPGTYQYDCSIGSHAAQGMVGTIIVEAAPNTVQVTFNVNMANETTSPDGVFLAGGADFGVAGDNPMSDDDNDDIWTITKTLPVGYTGNYTFLNGNCPDWSCKENINGQDCADGPYADRLLSNITENTTVSTCFSQCTTDGICEAPAYQPVVTFQVDMSNAELTGTETIYVTGSMDGWCGPCTVMTDDNGDNIYTVDLALAPSQGYEFKYMINDWGGDENAILGTDCDFVPGDGFGNRGFDLGTMDTTLAVQCFNYCGTCDEQNAAVTYDLTFNVNTENITVGPNGMYLGGGVFGDAQAHAMSDDDGDGTYTVTVSVPEGTSGNYIFLNSPNDGGDWGAKENLSGQSCADPGNYDDRILPAVTGPATYSTCFGECSTDGTCGTAPESYAVTFQVDMSDYSGSYGTVNLNGSFAGWCGGCIAMDDSDGDMVYSVTVDIAADTIEYKFTLDGWTAQEEFAGGESCTSTIEGFTNRSYIVAADATLPVVCYNSCDACDGDGGGGTTDTFDVTFNVNTENIEVGPNGMYLGGGVFGDAQAHAMSDADGDGTYTVTVNVAAGLSGNYIFLNSPNDGGDWGAKENLGGLPCSDPANFDDRILDPVTENTTISTCFGQCSTDGTCEAPPATSAITFQVDMSQHTGGYGTVNLNGSFAGWCGSCIAMDDSDGDMVYSVTVDIVPDTIEYKFTLDGWTAQEEFAGGESCTSTIDGFTNRSYIVDGDATLPVVCYNSCDACETVECLLDSAMVTLTVDMSEETVNPIGVFVAGNFQGWTPGATLATDNGDGTWSHSFMAGVGDTIQYKWLNGTAWGFEETVPSDCQYPGDSNRGFEVPCEDYSHPVHCYGSCNPCGAATYAATFTVLTDNITVAADGMHVAGAFEGWSGTAMSDNGDGSWSITLDLEVGSYEFKFQNGLGGWEELDCGGNRMVSIDGSGAVSYTGCFAQCGESTACVTDPDPANVTFQVDMSEVVDLIADSVYVIGSFTDPVWQAGGVLMSDADGDLIYEATVLISGPAGISYKFYNGNPFPNGVSTEEGGETADFAAGGCGVDNGVGGFNRTHTRSGSDETLGAVCFNSCSACGVAEGTPVTFSVDMNGYGSAFGFVNVSGTWNEFCGDCNQMTDDDMDGIWTATINLPEGDNYRYKYQVDAWADQEDLAPANDPVGPCVVTEGGFTNRDLDVAGTDAITLDTVCWASCHACIGQDDTPGCNDDTASNYDASATANDGSCIYDVTFSVNMNEYALADGDSLYVNANFNGWCGTCNPMSDDDADGVWTVTIPLASDYYEYKFTINGWSAEENLAGLGGCVTENFGFTNRTLQVFANQSQPVVCWNSCENCSGVGAILGCTDSNALNYAATATEDDGSCQYNVTFQVDMANEALASEDVVYVNGSFNGWCGGCNPMSDDDMDGVWTLTIPLTAGDHEHKFTINEWAIAEEFPVGAACDFNPADGFANRGFTLSSDLVLDVVCFNSCYSCDVNTGCTDGAAQNYDSNADVDDGSCAYLVTLQVDMTNQEVVAGTYVAGSFQGWNAGGTPMDNPGMSLYTITLQLGNGAHDYKFINGGDWAGEEGVPAECGADNGLGGFNRQVVVSGADITVDVVCFGECAACAGCTDPFSAEFSPFAGSDDGSCATPLVFGCTYTDADNYDPAANSEDGSCVFTGGPACPTDLDGDGATAVGDLLIILGSFGQPCE